MSGQARPSSGHRAQARGSPSQSRGSPAQRQKYQGYANTAPLPSGGLLGDDTDSVEKEDLRETQVRLKFCSSTRACKNSVVEI